MLCVCRRHLSFFITPPTTGIHASSPATISYISRGRSCISFSIPRIDIVSVTHSQSVALKFQRRQGASIGYREGRSEENVTEPLEVEILTVESQAQGTGSTGAATGFCDEGEKINDTNVEGAFVDVTTIDTFARARVLNFVKRHKSGGPSEGPSSIFQVGTMSSSSGDLYHAKIHIPVDTSVFGTRIASGIGATAKEAEYLAAMHAELIIDALGLQIYALTSSQERHASNARKAGRWAPLPTDSPREGATPSPPPLQKLPNGVSVSRGANGNQSPEEFTMVERGGGLGSLDYTIASVHFLDRASEKRIRSFFLSNGGSFPKAVRMVKYTMTSSGKGEKPGVVSSCVVDGSGDYGKNIIDEGYIDGKGGVVPPKDEYAEDYFGCDDRDGGDEEFLRGTEFLPPPSEVVTSTASNVKPERRGSVNYTQLKLGTTAHDLILSKTNVSYQCEITLTSPVIPASFGSIVCKGVAFDTKTAMQLACMHVELTIDAIGLPLFDDTRKQSLHHNECMKMGRWCVNGAVDVGVNFSKSESVIPIQEADIDRKYTRIKPLKFHLKREEIKDDNLSVQSSTSTSTSRTTTVIGSNISKEDQMLIHAKIVDEMTRVHIPIDFMDNEAIAHLKSYLRRITTDNLNGNGGQSTALETENTDINFFKDTLGYRSNTTHRCTLYLPTPDREFYGERVACGIAGSQREAETMCAMHALQILGKLEIPVFSNISQQEQYYTTMHEAGGTAAHFDENVRVKNQNDLMKMSFSEKEERPTTLAHVVSPPLFKLHCRDRKGRIYFGISMEEQDIEWGEMQYLKKCSETYETELEYVRKRISRDFWSLEPDCYVPSTTNEGKKEGRIIISPTTGVDTKKTFLHTCSGARFPDTRSIDRLTDYLERNGREGNNYISMTFSESYGVGNDEFKRELYRVIVPLPVPSHFGLRTAIGEGPSAETALRSASIHAELLLDNIGVQMYDHQVYQRRHAESARQTGRWAPLPETVVNIDTAVNVLSPPPVRQEEEGSYVWTVLVPLERGAQDTRGDKGLHNLPLTSQAIPTDIPKNKQCGHEGDYLDDSDAMLDLSRYTSVPLRDISLSARTKVEKYFHTHEANISTVDRWSAKPNGENRMLHFASIVVPLPPEYGVRKARGCAASRKDAYILCLNHAERIIDDLNICIDPRPKQQIQHFESRKQLGRKCPRPGDSPHPPQTYSTFGFKCIQELVSNLEVPEMPDFEGDYRYGRHIESGEDMFSSWFTYTRKCQTYILSAETNLLLESSKNGITPRFGVYFEDNALAIVEKKELCRGAINSLRAAASKNNFEVPESFNVQQVGDGPDRKYYVTAELMGTPFMARGMMEKKHDAICLCAMHFRQMMDMIISLTFKEKLNIATQGVMSESRLTAGEDEEATSENGVIPALKVFDYMSQEFTSEGKVAIVSLFAKIMPPFMPIKESITTPRTASPTDYHFVASLEMDDDVGLKQYIKVVYKEPKKIISNADENLTIDMIKLQLKRKAYADLFTSLEEKKRTFNTLLQFIKTYPFSRLDHAVLVKNVETDNGPASQLLKQSKLITPSTSSTNVTEQVVQEEDLVLINKFSRILRSSPASLSILTSGSPNSSIMKFAEEYPQLLTSFVSNRPLADFRAFKNACETVAGLAESDVTKRQFTDGTTAEQKDLCTLLEKADSKLLHMSAHTILELERHNFVEVVHIPFLEVERLMSETTEMSERKNTRVKDAERSPTSVSAVNNITVGNLTSRSIIHKLKDEKLLVAMPTAFGVVCARFIAKFTAKREASEVSEGPGKSIKELQNHVFFAKMLFLGVTTQTYDFALTACALDGTNWSSFANACTTNRDISSKEGKDLQGNRAEIDFIDVVLAAQESIIKSSFLPSSSRKINHVQLIAKRKELHDAVTEVLKEMTGNIVLSRMFPHFRDLAATAATESVAKNVIPRRAASTSSDSRALTAKRLLFSASLAACTVPFFSLQTVVVQSHKTEELAEVKSDLTGTTAEVAKTPTVEHIPIESLEAVYGCGPYRAPEGGVLRVVPQRITQSVQEAKKKNHVTVVGGAAEAALNKPSAAIVGGAATVKEGSTLGMVANQSGGGSWAATISRARAQQGSTPINAVEPMRNVSDVSNQKSSTKTGAEVNGVTERKLLRLRIPTLHSVGRQAAPRASSTGLTPESDAIAPFTITKDAILDNAGIFCYLLSPTQAIKFSDEGLRIAVVSGMIPLYATDDVSFKSLEKARRMISTHIGEVRQWGESVKEVIRKFAPYNVTIIDTPRK